MSALHSQTDTSPALLSATHPVYGSGESKHIASVQHGTVFVDMRHLRARAPEASSCKEQPALSLAQQPDARSGACVANIFQGFEGL